MAANLLRLMDMAQGRIIKARKNRGIHVIKTAYMDGSLTVRKLRLTSAVRDKKVSDKHPVLFLLPRSFFFFPISRQCLFHRFFAGGGIHLRRL